MGEASTASLETNGSASSVSESKAPAGEAASNGKPPASPAEEEQQPAWSKTQELALVSAMKKYPKEAADRWGQIAAAVPGKNKAECYTRYQELRKTFKKTKGK